MDAMKVTWESDLINHQPELWLRNGLGGRKKANDYERELVNEIERLRAALEKIAGEDFRGNRSPSAVIAYKALHNEQ